MLRREGLQQQRESLRLSECIQVSLGWFRLKPVFMQQGFMQLKAVLWLVWSCAQEAKLFFRREAGNKNIYVNKKPEEQVHKNISATKLDDGSSRWWKGLEAPFPNRAQTANTAGRSENPQCRVRNRTFLPSGGVGSGDAHRSSENPGHQRGSHKRFLAQTQALPWLPRQKRPPCLGAPGRSPALLSVCLHSALSENPVPTAGSLPPPSEMPPLSSQGS